MRRLLLMVLFAELLAPSGLHAQKVYKEGNKVVLDMTAGVGMPAGAVTNTSKSWSESPQNEGGPMQENTSNGSINAKVYQKLEVAPYDMNDQKVIGGSGTKNMDWATAFDGCRNSNNMGGGWRLPTQRELQMMYIFKPALDKIFSDTAFDGAKFADKGYWSATEDTDVRSWYLNFNSSLTNPHKKNTTVYVRCVREITD